MPLDARHDRIASAGTGGTLGSGGMLPTRRAEAPFQRRMGRSAARCSLSHEKRTLLLARIEAWTARLAAGGPTERGSLAHPLRSLDPADDAPARTLDDLTEMICRYLAED